MPAMPLDALAPDQRAVVQLILQRDRSYADIAELLKISEDAVRARAHAGLSALAPEVELPADKIAQIADFLLGQQNGKPRQSTRKLLRDDDAARAWAETVRGSLEDVGEVPDLPAGGGKAVAEAGTPLQEGDPLEASAEEPAKPAPRPRPLREGRRPVAATEPEETAAASSSRLGGALLIGGAVLAIVVVVLALFVFKGDDNDKSPKSSAAASATATPSATPQQVGRIALKGTNGSKAAGVMTLYTAQNQLAFTLQGANVPKNKSNEAYAVWFTTPGGGSQRLGFAQPVTANGQLGTTGPRTADLDKFPRWLAKYKQVVVSRERNGSAKQPGPVVLRGKLPTS
jgi:Sigma-70, region 4/Anti-sigma-K factor rskA, C-terminal